LHILHAAGYILNVDKANNAATVGNGVYVAATSLYSNGRGLFADRQFNKGDYITRYCGPELSRQEALALHAADPMSATHFASLPTGLVIAGLTQPVDGEGGGSFANHSKKQANASLEPLFTKASLGTEAQLYVVAKKTILPGTEILVNYGSGYWAMIPIEGRTAGVLASQQPVCQTKAMSHGLYMCVVAGGPMSGV
jgi:hypothetical protein